MSADLMVHVCLMQTAITMKYVLTIGAMLRILMMVQKVLEGGWGMVGVGEDFLPEAETSVGTLPESSQDQERNKCAGSQNRQFWSVLKVF